MKTWLLLDVSCLCYRAYHTTGGLTHKEIPTGVVYGFLRDVINLCEAHDTANVVFCFDVGKSLRCELHEGYKATRHANKSLAERQARREIRNQMQALRQNYLPRCGFSNVFHAHGFEADDVIASICKRLDPKEDEAVIVSSDKDLYQLLAGHVRIWSPSKGKAYTLQSLHSEFGVLPRQWRLVKAIAGCKTDEIPGVAGVGEKTAAKFVRGELQEHAAAYKNIKSNDELIERNYQLVRLPYKGTPQFALQSDRFSISGWRSVLEELGLKSLKRSDVNIFTGGRRRGLGLK